MPNAATIEPFDIDDLCDAPRRPELQHEHARRLIADFLVARCTPHTDHGWRTRFDVRVVPVRGPFEPLRRGPIAHGLRQAGV